MGVGSLRKKLMKEHGTRDTHTRAKLDHANFGTSYSTLNGVACLIDCCVIQGVIKRFWDTNNTFHLPFAKMTITTYDFAMLMGVGFEVEHVVYQEDFHMHLNQLFHLFGPIIEYIP